MSEEIKTPIATLELIVILFLFVVCIVFYYKWDESKKELNTIVQTQEAKKKADEINKPKEEVDERERNVYPQINANIAQINNNIKSINATLDQLKKNQITKEQSYETFKNKSIDEINSYLNANNIPTTIIRK